MPATTNTTNNQIELEKAAYTVALDAYNKVALKRRFSQCKTLLKNHPNGIYVGNAYFWLAEFYLAVEPADYKAAKQNYNIVATRWSKLGKGFHAQFNRIASQKMDATASLANQRRPYNSILNRRKLKFIQKK